MRFRGSYWNARASCPSGVGLQFQEHLARIALAQGCDRSSAYLTIDLRGACVLRAA